MLIGHSLIPEELSLKKLLPSKKRKNDRKIWFEGAYVVTEGYLTDFEEQGPESCNCNRSKASLKNGDVHMFLSLQQDAVKIKSLVVEITPLFKKQEPDYKKYLQKNMKLRVFGYLFYDVSHEKDSFTTCRTCSHIWRNTPWEIHPITRLEIVED